MIERECNLRAGVYKVQTFGTTQPGQPCPKGKKCQMSADGDGQSLNVILTETMDGIS